jgi:hypothetical protein
MIAVSLSFDTLLQMKKARGSQTVKLADAAKAVKERAQRLCRSSKMLEWRQAN